MRHLDLRRFVRPSQKKRHASGGSCDSSCRPTRKPHVYTKVYHFAPVPRTPFQLRHPSDRLLQGLFLAISLAQGIKRIRGGFLSSVVHLRFFSKIGGTPC